MFDFFRRKRRPEPSVPSAPEGQPPPPAVAPLDDGSARTGASDASPPPTSPPADAGLGDVLAPSREASEVAEAPTARTPTPPEPVADDRRFAPAATTSPASPAPSAPTARAAPVEPPGMPSPAVDVPPGAAPMEAESPAPRSWRERLKAGLGLSRNKLADALTGVFRRRTLDEAALEELESALLQADVGVAATQHLVDDLRERYRRAGPDADPRQVLRDGLTALLAPLESPLVIGAQRPYVIMLAGVNGAGKTTSIGKLAKWLREQGLTVLLAAGDTFRAAAREQLAAWGERNNVTVVQQQGGDPAAVVFDAIGAAKARGIDVVIADTAGRLPTQAHLMEELAKIRRVTGKARDGAPDSVLLVLDANTGQNGLAQVKAFDAAVGLTGLIVTKLDGSAKGGVVAAIAKQHPVPLQFIGVGEGLDDLRPFVARDFVDALLPDA